MSRSFIQSLLSVTLAMPTAYDGYGYLWSYKHLTGLVEPAATTGRRCNSHAARQSFT